MGDSAEVINFPKLQVKPDCLKGLTLSSVHHFALITPEGYAMEDLVKVQESQNRVVLQKSTDISIIG